MDVVKFVESDEVRALQKCCADFTTSVVCLFLSGDFSGIALKKVVCEANEEKSSREWLTPNHLLVGVGGPTAFSIRRQGFIFNFHLARL